MLGHMNGNEAAYFNAQGGQYINYWMNVGNANWSWGGGTLTPAGALALGPNRHMNQVDCQFVDGHVKSVPYNRAIGDICLWTTDADGAHPACN